MLPVSSNHKNKAELLQERQNRLAKWKQKKTQSDEQKKAKQNNLTNNEGDNQGKQVDKQSKLQEWKKRKLERDQERRNEVSNIENDTQGKKKQLKNKNAKRKPLFDVSDEEPEAPEIKIFIPKANITHDENDHVQTNVKPMGSESNSNVDKKDPFEEFMQIVSQKGNMPISSSRDAGDLLDGEDNRLETEDIEFENNDIDEYTRYAKIAKMKSKKQVYNIKYTPQDLEPFRKTFYSQSEELNSLSQNEIDELRLSLGNIKIKGENCPVPITRWSQLGLTTEVMNLITKTFEYEFPTPIQSQAIPAIMSGRDVIGISKTGSGKTISYVLPLIRQIKAQRPLSSAETGPLGLILAPTRELALQINEEVEKFTKDDSMINSICCTGGSELKQQIKTLKRGIEIVVATPGRFIDLLTLNTGKLLSTKRITFVVMDEADRLFDLGFEPQITQIMKTIRPDKQCVLFSATFPNKLRSFALRVLKLPLSITISSTSLVNENVAQKFDIFQSEEEKFLKLLKILDDRIKVDEEEEQEEEEEEEGNLKDEKIIIFVSSQQICDILFRKLSTEGYNLFSIHAGKPYQDRVKNLENFKSTRNSILICTEVLSRGLNVPEVSLVIIFNAVKTFAQYVHTTGRTARGTKTGVAISLLLENELSASYILSKALRKSELSEHDPKAVQKLHEMSNTFKSGMKDGKYKISSGFGGKGLDNLESKREEKQIEERQQFENGNSSSNNKNGKQDPHDNKSSTNTDSATHIQIPKLQYTVIQNSNPDGSKTFSANINVNDLPQLVRWEATKNTTLMFIKRETGCSITNKGKYYPEGKSPESPQDEPKLYLLVESQEEKDIRLSIELLEQKVKEGVRKVSNNSIKDTKY